MELVEVRKKKTFLEIAAILRHPGLAIAFFFSISTQTNECYVMVPRGRGSTLLARNGKIKNTIRATIAATLRSTIQKRASHESDMKIGTIAIPS